ncbi:MULTISPECIES: hypothetical protein [unclassified Sulfurospirillum]|uniref:esterase/lipase family protein n=1 Tax=unclassified Sulfurospirillum TaxID=2618290 RepID=UPI0004FF96B0|nr:MULTISPECIES: hypothetical protein [unclassified Sulfurospirillum]KFL33532.1 hypothetical protein JU57_11065 [Sulfurospirillum sp. SCADC]
MTRVLIILVFMSSLCTAVLADHDDHHITFINQTKHHLKFEVLGLKNKSLHAHVANYVHIDDCKHDGQLKNFEIKIKHLIKGAFDKNLQDAKGNDLVVHRKCGESLYIWHENGEYKISDEPHVKADLSGCNTNASKPAILFVHGYNSRQGEFDAYAEKAENKKWRVFRTSVSQDGSIAKRADMLSKYIKKAAKECNIKNDSLRVVAHSMGGLDIRYLVGNSKYADEAKKIERIYTIATPHQGDKLGYFADIASDAGRDLTPVHMGKFNKEYPYASLKYHNKSIDIVTLRASCSGKDNGEKATDGMVAVMNQIYGDAPFSTNIHKAKHFPGAVCVGDTAELEKTSLLDSILKDHHHGSASDNIQTGTKSASEIAKIIAENE